MEAKFFNLFKAMIAFKLYYIIEVKFLPRLLCTPIDCYHQQYLTTMEANPLVSTNKASDSGLRILLHPLVLLTISDYITRHTLRRSSGPIVGALIGQQNGRKISLEHAFEAQVMQGNNGDMILHEAWFGARLQQYKDVHKAPALELVGWFTTAPVSGPQLQHIPIHQQIMHTYNESAVLLAFHPTNVLEGATVGGKLPLTIYESVYESEKSGEDGDRVMQLDGHEVPLDFKFKELPYSVETGEAEMISVDFVARGGGNATAVDGGANKEEKGQASQTPVASGSLKEQGTKKEVNGVDDSSVLSAEDEERAFTLSLCCFECLWNAVIAALTARANAVKMLHSRIHLLKSYLSNLPPCYLTTPPQPKPTPKPTSETATSGHAEINHPILRSIQALINRLPLLIPSDQESFEQESLAEKSDVSLVEMLGTLGRSVKDARELGAKFAVVEAARQASKKGGSMTGTIDPSFLGGENGLGMGGDGYVMD